MCKSVLKLGSAVQSDSPSGTYDRIFNKRKNKEELYRRNAIKIAEVQGKEHVNHARVIVFHNFLYFGLFLFFGSIQFLVMKTLVAGQKAYNTITLPT